MEDAWTLEFMLSRDALAELLKLGVPAAIEGGGKKIQMTVSINVLAHSHATSVFV